MDLDRLKRVINKDLLKLVDELEAFISYAQFKEHESEREISDFEYTLERLEFLLNTYFIKK